MKVGMNLLLWTAAADDSHFSLVEDLSKWGFDGVEFPMFDPDCSPWARYKEHLDNLGMSSAKSFENNMTSDKIKTEIPPWVLPMEEITFYIKMENDLDFSNIQITVPDCFEIKIGVPFFNDGRR